MNKNLIIVLVFSIFYLQFSVSSQSLLPSKWKFNTGDNLEWATNSFNDSAWNDINTNDYWEQQGYANYDGFAWYRATVVFPISLKSKAEKFGGFSLKLGKIDDVDCTYFNGEILAQTGIFPPKCVTKYNVERNYTIPANKIKWGEPNVIAIRVYDERGDGGIYGGNVSLTLMGIADHISMGVKMNSTNNIFCNTSTIKIPVSIKSTFAEKCTGELNLIVMSDFKKEVLSISKKLTLSSSGAKELSFEATKLEPGFYNGILKFDGDGTSKTCTFSFGIDPEKIVSPTDRPSDFQDYWDRARRELAAVAPLYKLIKKDSLCTKTLNTYLVEMRSLGNVLVRGWYVAPKKEGKYPAIVQFSGYSGAMSPDTLMGDKFVVFSLNTRGHANSRDNVNPGFPGYLQYFIADKEQYIYRGAYMDCTRAIDFIYSRPEADTTNVVVMGGSQGGALTIATAALNNTRIKLIAPAVPFLSDFRDYFKVANWPNNEFSNFVHSNPSITWETVYNTLSYVDIKNLAPWIRAKTFMAVGLLDTTCPPHINFAAYNQISAPKEYVVYPLDGHGLSAPYYLFRKNWVVNNLNNK